MPRAALAALLLASAMATGSTLEAQTVSGAAVYDKYCAQCHNQLTARIATRDALQKM